ncbi:hypothetical protein MUCCIDRAFT_87019 [Mucor lusitanicus CBS 277.49]|uniref:Putative zinc-finger domain-containing protein n=3 Tax=Mucor circinelloides f. lusitanicus TaxID=29924 RepID=A0A162R6X0_MUCCL|nr:hypothetical protein MUCCIDRAFT_87019 [Mucor lusitanicus CBS 277.49]
MLRQNGTASPEPSTVENPLVSDNSTAALNSVSVSVAPSSRAMGARPITTITYVPTETSFIRSILPGGREPANSSKPMPPKPMPQKPMAVQKSKPLPQAKASKASVSLPPKDPVKNSTPTPVSAQISTIPKNPPSSLKLSDNPSLSASNTPSASSTHPQTSPSTNPPPQQNTPSTFQPYRSALDSLGVTSGMDVRHKKTGILCRAESNGGVCNDKSCCDMHFTDFTHT